MHHPPLDVITSRLLDAARCAEQDLDLCSHIARTVVQGQPVPPATLASSLSTTQHDLLERLARLPGVEVDQQGHILGWGLTLVPTAHQVRLGGKFLFAWCAFDAIQIPPALHVEAQIHSTCAATGTPIRFVLTAKGEIQDLSEPQACLSLLLPEPGLACFPNATTQAMCPAPGGKGGGWATERPAFCEQSLFFQSEVAASVHLATHQEAVLLSLEEAVQVTQVLAHHCVR